MQSVRMRKFVRIAGIIILVVSLVYLGQSVAQNLGRLYEIDLDWSVLAVAVIVCVALYTVALITNAVAWGLIVAHIQPAATSLVAAIWVYGRSQIAKYLPGNVFHYAGRHVIGQRIGWSHVAMGAASVIEAGLVLAAALSATVILGASVMPADWVIPPLPVAALLAAVFVATPWALMGWVQKRPRLAKFSGIAEARFTPTAKLIISCAAIHLFFVAAIGGATWVLWWGAYGDFRPSLLPMFVAAGSAAWLVGFVTPGAPGGVGVREAAMVLLLAGTLGESEALIAALLMRVVTTAGDLAFFLLASAIGRK